MWEMKTLKDLVIIKAFVPEKIPNFVGTESMFDFVVWNLSAQGESPDSFSFHENYCRTMACPVQKWP